MIIWREHRNLKLLCTLFCSIVAGVLLLHGKQNAEAATKLRKSIPALCYDCHKDLKKGLADPHTHFLFKQGKCISCHTSHVSNERGLLSTDITEICLDCHKALSNLLRNAKVHSAVTGGKCTDCHAPHSSRNRHLTTKKEKALCLECHQDLTQDTGQPYGCSTFKRGECSACHDSHASTNNFLLNADPNSLCTRCHAPLCTAENISISSITKKKDCTSCHTGHGAPQKGALGPFGHLTFLNKQCEDCHNPIISGKKITVRKQGAALCLDCHTGDDATYIYAPNDLHIKGAENPCVICHSHHASARENLTKNESSFCADCHEKVEKKTRLMEKNLKEIKCTPVKNRQCFDCHIPMHSDLAYNFRDFPINLCSRCHVDEHSTSHPVGNDVIDPRNGDPVTCISCHSMHDARSDFMLTFDRNKTLCIQCHKM